MRFKERVDKRRLKHILDNKDAYDLGSVYINGRKSDNSVYTLLSNYFNTLNHKGEVEIEYLQSKSKRYGRHWPQALGITGISKRVRHTIASQFNIDIDVVNCHPIILEQLCTRNGIQCPTLTEYNTNRDQFVSENPEIKQKVLEVVNGASESVCEGSVFLTRLYVECYKIREALKPHFKKIHRTEAKSSKPNIDGRFVSNVLQDIENSILMAMVDSMKSRFGNIAITSLAYDGFTIERTNESLELLNSMLESLESDVLLNTGYTIQLKVKQMDGGYVIPTEELGDIDEVEEDADAKDDLSFFIPKEPFTTDYFYYDFIHDLKMKVFDSLKDGLNFVYSNIGKVLKILTHPDMYIVNQKLHCLEFKHKNISSNIAVRYMSDGKLKSLSLQKILNDPNYSNPIPMYKSASFVPKDTTDDFEFKNDFNTFTGIRANRLEAITEDDMREIEPILNHLRYCWASGNEEVYNYLLAWFQSIFKDPCRKTEVAIILYGKEGTGKGFLNENFFIEYVFGSHVSGSTQGIVSLTQRFNSFIDRKLFVCANEVILEKNNKLLYEKLKAIITDKSITIENKGIDLLRECPSYLNLILTTNNLDAVKIGSSDRRFVCLETSDTYKNDLTYFNKLRSACNQRTADIFYTYLLNIPKIRDVRNLIKTELKADMSVYSIGVVERFIGQFVEFVRGDRPPDMDWENRAIEMYDVSIGIKASQLFSLFGFWSAETKENKFDATQSKFYRDLRRMKSGLILLERRHCVYFKLE